MNNNDKIVADGLVAEVVDNGGKRFCMLVDWDALPVGTKVYSASTIAALKEQLAGAYEQAASLCDAMESDMFDQYKGRGKHAPNNEFRASTYMNGQSDGAGQCAAAIRALASQPAAPVQPEGNPHYDHILQRMSAPPVQQPDDVRAIGHVVTYNKGGSGESKSIEPIGRPGYSLAETLEDGALIYTEVSARAILAASGGAEQVVPSSVAPAVAAWPTNDEVYVEVCRERGKSALYVSTNAVNDVMAAVRRLAPAAPSGEAVEAYPVDDGVAYVHPQYGSGVFFTFDCAKPFYTHPAPSSPTAPGQQAQAVPEGVRCWQPITKPGQVGVGTPLRFTIGDDKYRETAKRILHPGTDKEEIIYNQRKNYYLITSMAIANRGSSKNVEFMGYQDTAQASANTPEGK